MLDDWKDNLNVNIQEISKCWAFSTKVHKIVTYGMNSTSKLHFIVFIHVKFNMVSTLNKDSGNISFRVQKNLLNVAF